MSDSVKKKAVKKTAKQQSKSSSEGTGEGEIGEEDVVISFDVALQTNKGEPVRVSGKIPLDNALVPMFLTDSQHTVENMVKQLIQDRFLLQTRHFFGKLKEDSIPKPELPDSSSGYSGQTENVKEETNDDFGFEQP